MAARFIRIGVGPSDARRWSDAGFDPDDVPTWSGLNPAVAADWRAAGSDLELALSLGGSGCSPADVGKWAEAGIPTEAITEWLAEGFEPAEARQWSFTSAGRARRLAGRGRTPELALERLQSGRFALAAQLDDRNESEAEEPRETPLSRVADQRYYLAVDIGCASCGQPISANGRCGCS